MSQIESLLKSLAPILAPIIVQGWESEIKPLIQAQIAKTNADAQVALNAFLAAVDTIVQTEAPKL